MSIFALPSDSMQLSARGRDLCLVPFLVGIISVNLFKEAGVERTCGGVSMSDPMETLRGTFQRREGSVVSGKGKRRESHGKRDISLEATWRTTHWMRFRS
jgi:hypothetical protein